MSTLDNPLPSISSEPDVLSPPSTFPPPLKAVVPVADGTVTVTDGDDHPDTPSDIQLLFKGTVIN